MTADAPPNVVGDSLTTAKLNANIEVGQRVNEYTELPALGGVAVCYLLLGSPPSLY